MNQVAMALNAWDRKWPVLALLVVDTYTAAVLETAREYQSDLPLCVVDPGAEEPYAKPIARTFEDALQIYGTNLEKAASADAEKAR